ncbi:MAG: CAP domain-containing protein [Candidatus Bathyarchaeia archaeon]
MSEFRLSVKAIVKSVLMAILVFALVATLSHTMPILPYVTVETAPNTLQTAEETGPTATPTPTPEATAPAPHPTRVATPTPSVHLPTPMPTPTPDASSTPTLTPTATQRLTPTVSPTPTPTATPTPTVRPTPTLSTYNLSGLKQYALSLINQDRSKFELPPVELGDNLAAQEHAEDMQAYDYLSHWGTDGLKPYMRYTLAGGFNYEAENAFISIIEWFGALVPTYQTDQKLMLEEAERSLMSSPGHRRNILNPWHKKVNIGIAYGKEGNKETLTLVQQFEGDYVEFNKPPTLSRNILSMDGKVTLGTVDAVELYYDPPPQPLSPEQLAASPYNYTYSLGTWTGSIISPPPPGYYYTNLTADFVQATKWTMSDDGFFAVEADVGPLLKWEKGVYTVVIWATVNDESIDVTNYSIFISN